MISNNNTMTPSEADDHIRNLDSSLVLRNLAFWLDLAIAKGRQIDYERINELSKSDTDNQSSLCQDDETTDL